jgi:hypothetical protein
MAFWRRAMNQSTNQAIKQSETQEQRSNAATQQQTANQL